MRIFTKCPVCRKRAFIVRVRTYVHPKVGWMKSQTEQCGKCFKNIRKLMNS